MGFEIHKAITFSIIPDSAIAKVGLENTAQITKVGSHEISNWQDLIQAVEAETKDKTAPVLDVTVSEMELKTSQCDT